MAAYHSDDYAPMQTGLHDTGSGARPFAPLHPPPNMQDSAGSSPQIESSLHGPPLTPGMPLQHPFLDTPAPHRPFMPQWWASNNNNALPPLGPPGVFPPALGSSYSHPAPSHPPPAYVSGSMLQNRPSVPNLHISTPSIHRPGGYANQAWTGTLGLGSLDLASPGFPSPQSAQMPVTPIEHESHRLGANLLSPQYALSRSNSTSSMGSVADSTGQFYSPLSAHGSDYFASEDDLRRVSASLNPPHQYPGGRHDTMSPGTIHLSRIHQARPDVKFEVASSVVDSDPGSPLSSALPSPPPAQAPLPPSPSKRRSCSPANTAPSPVSSAFSDVSDDWPPRPEQVVRKAATSAVTKPAEPVRPSLAPPKPSDASTCSPAEEDGYASPEDDEDDDFRPAKRTRSRKRPAAPRRPSVARRRPSPHQQVPEYSGGISRSALAQRYPLLVHELPLFYHALMDDMTMNPLAAPMIGTIPSFASLDRKCELLRDYFHRGRRKLQQLDAFTGRCDARNDLPGRLPELSEAYRVAIRDVRRKIVERCENYKYTRRDILTKLYGKDNWEPIEAGLILWDAMSGNNDPANDLAHLDLGTAGRDVPSVSLSVAGSSRSSGNKPTARAPPASSPGSTSERTVRPIPSRSYLRTRPSPGAVENSSSEVVTTAAVPESQRQRRVSTATPAKSRRGGGTPARMRNDKTDAPPASAMMLPGSLVGPPAPAAGGPGPGAGPSAQGSGPGTCTPSTPRSDSQGSYMVPSGAVVAERRVARNGSSPASPSSLTSSSLSTKSS